MSPVTIVSLLGYGWGLTCVMATWRREKRWRPFLVVAALVCLAGLAAAVYYDGRTTW